MKDYPLMALVAVLRGLCAAVRVAGGMVALMEMM